MVTGGWFILVLPTLYKQNFLVDYGDFGAAPLATAWGTSESWQSSHGLPQRLNGRFCRPCGAKDFWKSSFPRLRMAAWKRPMRLRLDVIGSLKWEERRWVLWWNRVFFLEDARQSIMKVWYHYCEPYPGSIRCEFGGNQCCFGAHFCLRFSIRI